MDLDNINYLSFDINISRNFKLNLIALALQKATAAESNLKICEAERGGIMLSRFLQYYSNLENKQISKAAIAYLFI